MSFLDKLKFWKKDEDEFLGDKSEPIPGEKTDELALPELNKPAMPEVPGAEPEMPKMEEPTVAPPPHLREYQPPQPQMQPGMPATHQLEIIDSKLDAIKAILSALDQRMATLERMSRHEKKYW